MPATTPPLVSICVLSYNHEPYLRESLDGIVNQVCPFDYEVLIHDDASKDRSQEIIREYTERYPARFKPILQTENQYSKGVKITITYNYPRAQGRYIAICEGDDYWSDPHKLQKQVEYMEAHPDCSMVYGRVRHYKQRRQKFGPLWGGAPETSFERLLEGNCIPTPTVLVRRSVIEDYTREIAPDAATWRMGDYPLWLYASLRGRIHFMEDQLAVYRVLEESASHFRDFAQCDRFCRSSYDICAYFARRYRPELLERILANSLWERLYHAIRYRAADQAAELRRELEARGFSPRTRRERKLLRKYYLLRLLRALHLR